MSYQPNQPPPPQQPPPSLPPGWKAYNDRASGKPYYHNTVDDSTTWQLPTAPAQSNIQPQPQQNPPYPYYQHSQNTYHQQYHHAPQPTPDPYSTHQQSIHHQNSYPNHLPSQPVPTSIPTPSPNSYGSPQQKTSPYPPPHNPNMYQSPPQNQQHPPAQPPGANISPSGNPAYHQPPSQHTMNYSPNPIPSTPNLPQQTTPHHIQHTNTPYSTNPVEYSPQRPYQNAPLQPNNTPPGQYPNPPNPQQSSPSQFPINPGAPTDQPLDGSSVPLSNDHGHYPTVPSHQPTDEPLPSNPHPPSSNPGPDPIPQHMPYPSDTTHNPPSQPPPYHSHSMPIAENPQAAQPQPTQTTSQRYFGSQYTPAYTQQQMQYHNMYGQQQSYTHQMSYNQKYPSDPQTYLQHQQPSQGPGQQAPPRPDPNIRPHHSTHLPVVHPGGQPDINVHPSTNAQPQPQPQQSKIPSAALGSNPSLISLGPDGSQHVTFISLELRAAGLRNRDYFTKSDPVCKVSTSLIDGKNNIPIGQKVSSQWKYIGETEVVKNSLSPIWTRRIRMEYRFDQAKYVRFELIDVDNFNKVSGQALGSCVIALADIVRNGSVCQNIVRDKHGNGNSGQLTIRAHDENAVGQVQLSLTLAATNLDKKDKFGKSDPYYRLKVMRSGNSLSVEMLYKSSVIKKNLNPTWEKKDVTVPTEGLPWSQISFICEVFDHDKFKKHDLIGEAKFTLEDLHQQKKRFAVINPSRLGSRNYANSGELIVSAVEIHQLHSFLSYLQGGLRLDFAVAVDFTASNKICTDSSSLHFLGDPSRPNPYEQALTSIGNTLLAYTADQTVTALGFGAILPRQAKASFDFALTGRSDARVVGVKNLLEAYRFAARSVTFSGPTFFNPILRNAMGTCSSRPVSQTYQHFTVLVILTDGVISDMRETIESIIDASYNNPLAITIVGIGNTDFSAMERLDGDDYALKSEFSGREAKHDIVQFTKFDPTKGDDSLPTEILRELPRRVQEYMAGQGIAPNQPTFTQQVSPPPHQYPPQQQM